MQIRVLCAFLVLCGLGLTQTFTGSILGTVRDQSGAAVPQAKVTVVNSATNAEFAAITNQEGDYIAPQLPPGVYRVDVSAAGFKRFTQDGIGLRVQQQARVDIVLTVGDVAESVQVTADAALVEATTSTVGRVIENRRVLDLPLNTRNVYELVRLNPGVPLSGGVGNAHNSVGYSVNGARGGLMDTVIDGQSASFPTVNGFHGVSVFPSVDAVAEFKVQAGNYSAEYGRSLGSTFNLVYKSGTNSFHGSAYNFLRNSRLDANNFFNRGRGIDLLSFKRNQFGGTLGGPIVKNRVFFMTSFEGLRQRSFSETLTTMPTALERAGDFSQTRAANGQVIQIFDPLTTRPNPNGAGFIRDQFPGNRIPVERMDRVARNVLRFYPMPNLPGQPVTGLLNFYNSGSARNDTNNFDVRIDQYVSPRQRIFGRYSYRRFLSAPPQLFPGESGQAEGRINNNDWGNNSVFEYNNTLTATTLLTARAGFSRNRFLFENQGLGFLPSSLGLPGAIDSVVDRQMFPRFSVSSMATLGGGDHRSSGFNNYSLSTTVARVQGSHNIKIGYEGRLLRINVWEAREAGGFSFNAGMTQGPDPTRASTTAGWGFASFLLGAGASGNILQNWKNVASQSFYHAFFVQDDWRVTRKLTLNLGLRYDVDTPRTERYNRMHWFDPSTVSPLSRPGRDVRGGAVFVGVDGNPRSQFEGDWNNIAPRIGLAYQVTSKTAIRAAFGQVFGPSNMAAQGTVGALGFRVDTPWVASLDNGLTPFRYVSNPFPDGFPPVPGARDGLLTSVGSLMEAPLRSQVVPYTLMWNFTIQQELPGAVLMEAAYVSNNGRQLSRGGEGGFTLNQLHPQYLALGNSLNELVDNPFFGQGGRGVIGAARVSRAQLLRPYPQFDRVFPLFSNGANSSYHALQLTFSKRYSHGMSFEGHYTWSKAIDQEPGAVNSYDLSLSKSLSGNHFPHRFVFSGIYELPFGKGRRFSFGGSRVADAVFGGWQVNGIVGIQSGATLGISANNTIGLFTEAARANWNGRDASLDGPVRSRLTRWFDTSAFSQPAPFTFGTAGIRVPGLRGHGINNVDTSLFKEFRPVEALRVQFRAEAFNALNRVQFSNPNTSVTSAAFGTVNTQANTPRQIQFGLKLIW